MYWKEKKILVTGGGGVRPEQWLGFAFTSYVAQRSVRAWREQVRFVRTTSLAASRSLALHQPADLIFIDADHSFAAVRQDLLAWSLRLAPAGILAFHDSRRCAARPDLTSATGPVRLMEEIEPDCSVRGRFSAKPTR